MTLLEEIRAAQAELEAMRRRKGIVTVAMVREALPPHARNGFTTYDLKATADALNAALDAAGPADAPAADHQTRAAGEA